MRSMKKRLTTMAVVFCAAFGGCGAPGNPAGPVSPSAISTAPVRLPFSLPAPMATATLVITIRGLDPIPTAASNPMAFPFEEVVTAGDRAAGGSGR